MYIIYSDHSFPLSHISFLSLALSPHPISFPMLVMFLVLCFISLVYPGLLCDYWTGSVHWSLVAGGVIGWYSRGGMGSLLYETINHTIYKEILNFVKV